MGVALFLTAAKDLLVDCLQEALTYKRSVLKKEKRWLSVCDISRQGKLTCLLMPCHPAAIAKLLLSAYCRLQVEMLLVPTVLQNYLIAEVEAEEKAVPPTWGKNALSGQFTNFVNLLDMAAISVPSAILKSPDLQMEANKPGKSCARDRCRYDLMYASNMHRIGNLHLQCNAAICLPHPTYAMSLPVPSSDCVRSI